MLIFSRPFGVGRRLIANLIPVWGALSAQPLSAAIQGDVAATSSGSVRITVSVASQATIRGLVDTSMVQNASGAITISRPACIWTNSATGVYGWSVSRTGQTGTLPDMRWVDQIASSQPLAPGSPLQGLVAGNSDPTCSTNPTGNLQISVDQTTSAATLTLTYSPL